MTQPTSMAARVAFLVSDLARDRNQLSALKEALRLWPEPTLDEARELVEQLADLDPHSAAVSLGMETVLQALAHHCQTTSRWSAAGGFDSLLPAMQKWYGRMPPESAVRNYILSWLTQAGTSGSLQLFARLCVADPPRHGTSLGLSFGPLMSQKQPHLSEIFPELLNGLQHAELATAILDLANHAFSHGRCVPHPAASRAAALRLLLGQVVDRMLGWGEQPPSAKSADEVRRQISETVGLVVALCRTLGLLRDAEAVSTLRRATEVKHRRVQAEAAGALALVGDPQGVATLIRLAESPASRVRAIAYADEVGALDQIEPQFRTDVARAEGALAAWLAEPTQFGVAPPQLELVDERELYWPGYVEPQSCYLFRFAYPTQGGVWTNIGITGPITHATSQSLEGLAAEQIYALFAGWQAWHDDVYEIDWKHLAARQREGFLRAQSALRDEGYYEIEPIFLGRFFGDEFVVATAQRGNDVGYLVWAAPQTWWLPDPQRQLTSELAYCVFKGERLLAAFNANFSAGPDAA